MIGQGLGQASQRERTYLSFASIADRNLYPASLRDWGMIVTVYDYPTAGNSTDYQLVYTLGADIADNAKWTVYTGGGGGSSKITILDTDVTDTGNVNAAETTIYTFSIPANTLGTNKQSIMGRSAGRFAASTDNLRLKMKLGGVTFFDSDTFVALDASAWVLDWEIIRVTANSQKCFARLVTGIGGNTFISAPAALTQDLTTIVPLIITAQGAVTNEIVRTMTKLFFEDI